MKVVVNAKTEREKTQDLSPFTSWLLISSPVSGGTKKNRRPVVFPVLGTLRTTCARVVNPRFICIIFPCAMLCPGQMVKKEEDRDLSSTSVICRPRHLFLNPQLTNGWMATCWLPSVQMRPQHPKCSLKQSFFAPTFFSKRPKIRVYFVSVCDNLFPQKD